jgi:CDP-paratose 2-epimerase
MIAPRRTAPESPVLITGGAGFIGTNLADRLLSQGRPVRIYDSLGRPGAERNLSWLRARHKRRLDVIEADIRDGDAVRRAVADVAMVFHFAAQVAVTTSLDGPSEDFAVNAAGTVALLEALRERRAAAGLLFTSTNKVYGALDDIRLEASQSRYSPACGPANTGICERRPLSFHSPYGCSKGAADQYVLDFARSYGLPSVVFRMSCVYGPHQHGTEDQGWVAHFLIRSLRGLPIAIYGDGRQVRDLLYVDDLVDAFLEAEKCLPEIAGEAFNIGGGAGNTISLNELLQRIAELDGARPRVRYDDWRVGDQRWYVSDHRKFTDATGWRPRTSVRDGVRLLHDWLAAEHQGSGALLTAAAE